MNRLNAARGIRQGKPVGGKTVVSYPAGGARMGGGAPAGQRIGDAGGAAVPPGFLYSDGKVWDDQLGWRDAPGGAAAPGPFEPGGIFDKGPSMVSRARGGPLPMMIAKPTLVGEEGPELILPTSNGSGHVVPADATAELLPLLEEPPVMRRTGGGLPTGPVMETAGGTFRAFDAGEKGSGFLVQGPKVLRDTVQKTLGPEFMRDPRSGYLMDKSKPGMPLLPDVFEEEHPWAEPGLPMEAVMEPEAFSAGVRDRARNIMRMRGARDPGRYGGLTFHDPAAGADEQNDGLTWEQMRDRVRARALERNNQAVEAGWDRARREMQERAVRQALDPIGGPSGQERAAMRAAGRDERAMSRFMRSPEGLRMRASAQVAAGNLERKRELAQQAVPVLDADGNVRGWTRADGASLKNPMEPGPGRTPAGAVSALEDVLRDPKAPLAQRELARREYERVTGVKLPGPSLPGGSAGLRPVQGVQREGGEEVIVNGRRQLTPIRFFVVEQDEQGNLRKRYVADPGPDAAGPGGAGADDTPSWERWLDEQE